jgi:hypothetical protein
MANATSPTYDAYISDGAGEHMQVRLARHWESTEDGWRRLECQSPLVNRKFGPEIALGRDLHTQIGATANIWIVQYIISGSNLHTDWDPDAVSGNQYYSAMRTFYNAQKALIEANMPGIVRYGGFCWTQGEADGMVEANADAYDDNLTNLIDNVVSDFGAGPFCFARLGTAQTDITFLSNMQTSQDNVDALGRSYVYMTNTNTYTTVVADNTHWDADSEIKLGQSYAADVISHWGW